MKHTLYAKLTLVCTTAADVYSSVIKLILKCIIYEFTYVIGHYMCCYVDRNKSIFKH